MKPTVARGINAVRDMPIQNRRRSRRRTARRAVPEPVEDSNEDQQHLNFIVADQEQEMDQDQDQDLVDLEEEDHVQSPNHPP